MKGDFHAFTQAPVPLAPPDLLPPLRQEVGLGRATRIRQGGATVTTSQWDPVFQAIRELPNGYALTIQLHSEGGSIHEDLGPLPDETVHISCIVRHLPKLSSTTGQRSAWPAVLEYFRIFTNAMLANDHPLPLVINGARDQDGEAIPLDQLNAVVVRMLEGSPPPRSYSLLDRLRSGHQMLVLSALVARDEKRTDDLPQD